MTQIIWVMTWAWTKGNNSRKQAAIKAIIELEEDIKVLNNVIMFHNILIKIIQLSEQTSFQTVNFHKQRAIIPASMGR